KRQLTEEQAVKTAEFLELNRKESYYFLLLVQIERAQSEDLKQLLSQQMKELQAQAKGLKGRVAPDAELSFEQQAIYYSNWIYTATHTLLSLPGFNTPKLIADKLHLPMSIIQNTLESLKEFGLAEKKQGLWQQGHRSTYLPPDSPFVLSHHQNWRQVSGLAIQQRTEQDFYFTAPMTISKEDFMKFRGELTGLISKLYKIVEKTKPEEIACINIDFFKF
ncbi:MAG TPA: TIGR02147 family protein, partial [Bdellovibrio sp.]|nr:TIGR02147 family protein [Bdellovibrio sp.]